MATGGSRWGPPRSSSYDRDRLFALQVLLCDRLDELLDELGVRGHRTSRLVTAPCPVHGGDRRDALNVYRSGESVPGYWRCHTRGCERTFRPTILGLVRGALSHRELGWSGEGGGEVKFREAVDWCCRFVGQELEAIKVDPADQKRRALNASIATACRRPDPGAGLVSRAMVRSRLRIPSPRFLARGFSAELLDRYDVGDCVDPTMPFHGRTIVPVYDDDHRGMVGFTGRSPHEQCPSCSLFHDGPCPPRERAGEFSKWRNSDDFHKESRLYNYWFAKKHVRETGTAILCEGPPDVLAFEAAGLRNALAMFGASLGDAQQVLLEASGALDVVLAMDGDEAGRAAAARLKKQLGRSFRVRMANLPGKDAGELSPEAIREAMGAP